MIYVAGWLGAFESDAFQKTEFDQAVQWIKDQPLLQLDVETSGLNPRKDRLYSIQLGREDDQYVFLWNNLPNSLQKHLIQVISNYPHKYVLHNAKFDYQFLKNAGADIDRVYCTMLGHLVLSNGMRKSAALHDLVREYLGIQLSKEVRKDFLKRNFTYTEESVVYAARDVMYLERLMNKQLELARKQSLEELILLESYCALAFGDMEYEGILIDQKEWMALYRDNLETRRKLDVEISNVLHFDETFSGIAPKSYQGDLFLPDEEVKKTDLNLNSPIQVKMVLQKIDPFVEDASAETIHALRGKHKIIDLISRYKQVSKLSTTYGKEFLDLLEDGRVHTSFRQILDTGRISSSRPNMQQLPSFQAFDSDGNPVKDEYGEDVFPFRHTFMPPEKGWVFVSADYSSQELCVIATGSEDPVWLEALRLGQDLHSVAADLVYGQTWKDAAEPDCAYMDSKKKCSCPTHKYLRSNVKAINFGLAYGMGPQKLAATLKISQSEAEDLIARYFKSFPRIKMFLEALGNFGKRHGYIRTFPPFKRVRYFQDWRKDLRDKKILGSIERQSKNTPIQGSSADMTKLALAMIRKEIRKKNYPVRLVMTVHDQIDTVCPESFAEKWAKELARLMEAAAKVILKNELLKSETQITHRWSK